MKEYIKKIIFLVLVLCTFTGCEKNAEISTTSLNVQKKIEKENYKYTQKLNVLEDNYRTYYEVFLYSFYDSNGDGIGDINGLIEKLDYINDGNPETEEDLGFNGIWLMPIMPSTTYHKYDVLDYYGIDSQYGTIEDFKKLIKECDKRGIKLIIDMVFNHTSSKHFWFTSAVKSLSIPSCGQRKCTEKDLCRKHNKYIGYYNFVKEKPVNGTYYPTGNGWYYEGVFWEQMPDLNLQNTNLRKELENIMEYWLDLGVGGFRLDAAKEYYSGAPKKNIEVLLWINEFVKEKSVDNYIVAEVWDSFLTYTEYYKSGIDSCFNFAFAKQDGKIVKTLNYSDAANSAMAFADAMILVNNTLKENNKSAIDAPFFTNHDMARAAGYFNGDENKLKMAAAMNLFMNGSAFVYYGEELGMKGSGKDENKRAPMYWSEDTSVKGMTAGPPEIEIVEHIYPSLEKQKADPNSIYYFYKRAIRLRNENPEIARGLIIKIESITDPDICAITKEYNKSKIAMIYNISPEEKEFFINKEELNMEQIRGYVSATGEEVTFEEGKIYLPPYSVGVLK